MDRTVAGWLTVILAVGFCLRLIGIDFGLPNTNCRPDEGVLVKKALAAAGGDLNPGFFHYPSFHIYTLAGLFGGCFGAGRLAGIFSTPQDFLLQYFIDPSGVYLAGRLLGALLGTASVYLVFLVGRQAAGVRAGLMGAAFLSVAFLHVRDSHYLTVDVPATFYLLLAAVLLQRFLRTGGPGWLAASALFSGIAVSTKYNAAIIIAVFACYLFFRALARSRRAGRDPANPSAPPVSLRHAAGFAALTAGAAALQSVDGPVGEDQLGDQGHRRPQTLRPLHQPLAGKAQVLLQLRRGMLGLALDLPRPPGALMGGDLLVVQEDAHRVGVAHRQHPRADQAVRDAVEGLLELHAPVLPDGELLAGHLVPPLDRQRPQRGRCLGLEQLPRRAADLLDHVRLVAVAVPAFEGLDQLLSVGYVVTALLLLLTEAAGSSS